MRLEDWCCLNPNEGLKTNNTVLIQGSRGASVKKRRHRSGSCQGDSRCCHVGSGKHKCAPHGNERNRTIQCYSEFSQWNICSTVTVCLFVTSGPRWFLWRNHIWAFWTGLHFSNFMFHPIKTHETPFFCHLLRTSCCCLPTDSERAWNGVQDEHSLFGCRHHDNAMRENNLLKFFLERNVHVAAVFSRTSPILKWSEAKFFRYALIYFWMEGNNYRPNTVS